jgi:hypothetical protein
MESPHARSRREHTRSLVRDRSCPPLSSNNLPH